VIRGGRKNFLSTEIDRNDPKNAAAPQGGKVGIGLNFEDAIVSGDKARPGRRDT